MTTFDGPSSSRVLGNRPLGDDADRLVYSTVGPPPGSPSGALFGYDTSVRGSSGWLSTPLGYPYDIESTNIFAVFAPAEPVSFSEDLRTRLWASLSPLTPDGPPEGETALYREVEGQPLELISEVGSIGPLEYPGFAGLSSDGGTIVFDTRKHILPADAARTRGTSIFAWKSGNLQEVDVDSGGALLSTCGAEISNANGMALSGRRVFFSVPARCNGTEKVYLRDLEAETTVEVSASQCARVDCNAAADVKYAGATPDGSFVYMTTTQQLTGDDEDSKRDLYAYEVATGELTLLSGGSPAAAGEVESVVAFPSENPGRVYFAARGELLPGESGSGEKLFLADGSGIHFVAEASIPLFAEEQQIQLTPDGRRALFVTAAKLLPGDTDSQADAYLYDADEEALTRISTGPSGGNGAFPASITAPSPLNLHGFEAGDLRPYIAIDTTGDRTFFTTEEPLVPEDTNGEFDVYEHAHGATEMITPGNLPFKSDFAGASRDGRTVLFATNADILPGDRDGNARDLYAARLGGGFPEAQQSGCDPASCPLPETPRLSRGAPPSTAPIVRRRRRLRVLRVARRPRRGAIRVVVMLPAPGLLAGRLWIRRGRRRIVLGRGRVGVARPGRTRLALRLRRFVRRRAGRRPRRVHLTVRGGRERVSRVVKVRLR